MFCLLCAKKHITKTPVVLVGQRGNDQRQQSWQWNTWHCWQYFQNNRLCSLFWMHYPTEYFTLYFHCKIRLKTKLHCTNWELECKSSPFFNLQILCVWEPCCISISWISNYVCSAYVHYAVNVSVVTLERPGRSSWWWTVSYRHLFYQLDFTIHGSFLSLLYDFA